MSRTVRVRISGKSIGNVDAKLTDEYSPRTFELVLNALPIESKVSRWGDEIYFPIPVKFSEENSKEIVSKGTIAYWPPGNSLCIFWGPTPISNSEEEIRPASPVNIIGRVIGDPSIFSKMKEGDVIRIERAK